MSKVIFLTILQEAHWCGQALMLDEETQLQVSTLIHPKGAPSVLGQSSFST